VQGIEDAEEEEAKRRAKGLKLKPLKVLDRKAKVDMLNST